MTALATNARSRRRLRPPFRAAAAFPPRRRRPRRREVQIDQFTFAPQRITVKAGTTVTWINDDDIPHTVASTTKLFKSKALDTKDKFSFTFATPGTYQYFCSLHPHMTGPSWSKRRPEAMRRSDARSTASTGPGTRKAGGDMMPGDASGDRHDTAQRFREAALPHLDDVYTLARYLLREPADAEDAVQECYLRALRHFDTFRGPEMKPWLFAILRNICRGEFVRRSRAALTIDGETQDDADAPAVAGAGALAGSANPASAGRQHRPSPRRGAAGAISGGDRAARDQRTVVSRDRRCRRRSRRHRHVAPGTCALPAADSVDCRGRTRGRLADMICAEAEILIHALLDGELDAGHAHDVEAHAGSCPRCAARLRGFRDLRRAMPAAQLRFGRRCACASRSRARCRRHPRAPRTAAPCSKALPWARRSRQRWRRASSSPSSGRTRTSACSATSCRRMCARSRPTT